MLIQLKKAYSPKINVAVEWQRRKQNRLCRTWDDPWKDMSLSNHLNIHSYRLNMLIFHLLLGTLIVGGHGDHSFDLQDLDDVGMSYAERHVNQPIDRFLAHAQPADIS